VLCQLVSAHGNLEGLAFYRIEAKLARAVLSSARLGLNPQAKWLKDAKSALNHSLERHAVRFQRALAFQP